MEERKDKGLMGGKEVAKEGKKGQSEPDQTCEGC